jgi:DNA polymerase I
MNRKNIEIKNLVFGKNDTRRIVSVEPDNTGNCEIFKELENGKIVSEIVPNKRFIIFKQPIVNNVIRLKGEQPYKYLKNYIDNETYYNTLKKCSKNHRDVFTIRDAKESFLSRYGYTYFKGMKHDEVSILSIDIEDTYGIKDEPNENGRLLLIGNTFRKNGKYIRKQFAYDDYDSESKMLLAWSKWVRELDPSILIGHNIFGHDLKIIAHAAKRHKVRLRIGRNGSEIQIANRDSIFRKDGSQAYSYKNISIYGREIIDTWFLAIKYDQSSRREYENYKLKYIIEYEGLEKSGRTHYDASNIERDYRDKDKWELIKKYNEDDSDDPLKYYDLVIPVFFQYAKSIPRSFQHTMRTATGSQVNSLMVRSYLQIGHSIAQASEAKKYPGAISFCVPGVHRNVFKVDVASLYPSIILSYNLIDRKKDPKAHMMKMLKYFTTQRLKNKQKHKDTGNLLYKILSDCQKILINSIYGFFGTAKLNYNCPAIAERVTAIGRELLSKSLLWATGTDKIPDNALGGNVKEDENENL